MVFESVVADVLNKILGDYVENLDKKQLKIGIWGGDVVLDNLKLRENALDDINLPIRLVYGYLGKLVLKIPWKNLYSQPVVAQIEDLYILISPKASMEYDAEKEEKFDLQVKQTALLALDEAHKQELQRDKPKPDASFTEKLTAQIVNNLQVKIANVHFRYEDNLSTGKPFSFGATLHDLELYTTDVNWEKCYLTEQVSRVFKIADLDSLSVYMNCTAELFSTQPKENLIKLFRENIASKDHVPLYYNYLFGPISSVAKLQLNMNPEYDDPPFVVPKIDLSLEMQKLQIGLTSTQFQDIVKFAESMNRMQLGAPYRKYRPYNKPYKNNYRLWWKFAITSVLEENIRKRNRGWTWEHIKEHRELCNTYAEKLKEKELSKKPAANLIETCTLLEQKLDLFNLILIRKRVQIEVDKIKKDEESKPRKSSWFTGWFGGNDKTEEEDSTDIATKFEAAMTNEEKAKLYAAIGYEENSVPLNIPENYQAIIMKFKLVSLEIGLYDDYKGHHPEDPSFSLGTSKTIMLLRFSMTTCEIRQRPAASALSITAGMKEMKLTGLEIGTDVPTLIESKISDEFNLLDIFFETNPLDKQCDQRIKVHARPLQIVYHAGTILHLIKVFSPPHAVNLSELEGAATTKISNFKERSATGMQYMIDQKNILDVDIQFMPNILIMPHMGDYMNGKKSLIVVTLGKLHIVSKPHKREMSNVTALFGSGKRHDEILENVMELAYDKFEVSVEDMQVLVAKQNEHWEDVLLSAKKSEMHVLRPTSILIDIGICIVDDDPRLPKTKVEIVIPAISLNITEDRVFEALNVVTSIPLPESEAPTAPTLHKTSSITSSRLSLKSFLNQDTKSKKSTSTLDFSGTEIVQYTSLELSFALKQFDATLYKSCGPQDKCSPTDSEAYGTPVENIENDIGNAVVTLEETSDSTATVQKIISFKMLQLEANFYQRTYEMVALAKLGAIQLLQYDSCEAVEERLSIIDTPRFSEDLQYLLTVSFTMAQRISPEFATKYNSTEQLININFSTLHITLHQECLLRLLEIANGLQQKLEAARGPSSPQDRIASAADEGIINKLTTIIEESDDSEVVSAAPPETRLQRQTVVDSIKLRVVAEMEQVAVLVTCRKRPLASLKVEHFDVNMVMKSSYTEVKLRLKDIIVLDLNPKNIHTSILSIVGNNALNCQVVMYNLNETSNYNSDDMKICVEIGCMKIVFLNWFVNSMLSFLNNFQAAQEAVAQASAAAADAAKQNALVAYEKATRMKLDIKIKAPIIVVPMDSQSTDAIALDLGLLLLHNTTSEVRVPNNERSPAVVDEIKLELKDMKLSKVAIVMDSSIKSSEAINIMGSTDTVDMAYGLKSNVNILDPMSFTLIVKRNLSSSWYNELPELDLSGRLKSIELNLFMEDYALLMSILNRNLNEGAHEFPPPTPPPKAKPRTIVADVHQGSEIMTSSRASMSPRKREPKTDIKIYEQMKFNFQFDGVVANLMLSNDEGLSRFGLYFLSVKGKKLIDGTLSTSVVLCNIQIDDTRKNSTSEIRKYLYRKDWQYKDANIPADILEECRQERNYMLDMTAIIKEDDTFAEVRVCAFDLILCVDYLLHLAKFFTLPEEAAPVQSSKQQEQKLESVKVLERRSSVSLKTKAAEPEKKMNLTLHIEEPDIILVESLEDINSNAIIFNAQAELNYRMVGEKQIINGEIDGLKMYMCSFMPERREATRHYIIHPCVISLQGSTPEMEGLHISLNLSEIIINVSPATIELLNKAMQTINAGSAEKVASLKPDTDYMEIWNPKRFKERDHWFSRAEDGQDALELSESSVIVHRRNKTEQCVIEVPCITLVIEMGVGYYTTPLISVDTRLNAIVSDWSGDLKVKGSLNLNMNYYNQALAVWEPLIELNEHHNAKGDREYLPWELNFGLRMESKMSEIDEDAQQNTTIININSEESLEITVSKTCLNLLGVLSEAFSQAIDAKGLVKPEVIAPYVVENDTGFDISINFKRGIFTLHECHMPKATTTNALNRSLLFQSGDEIADFKPEQVKNCKVSPSGRAYLQTKDLASLTSEEDEEYKIYMKVGDIDKEVVLPVSKSDKRYFPLYRDTNQDAWGIVSEVRSEYGTTKVNIHGVVNVHNHFTTNVRIYRNKPGSITEKIFVGEVAPNEVYHVPLHAIYAEDKELYFTVEGYKVSVQGIKWTDCPTDLEYSRQLQCDPIDTFETFYINVMRVKTEIFHELSDKYTLLSAFFTLHLRPPLYLCNALPISIKVSVAGCSVRRSELHKENNTSVRKHKASSSVKEDLLDYGEKEVHPGNVLHLPTVKLLSKSNESQSFLVVRLIQYLEKDWSCTTEISQDHKDLATWKFSSYDSEAKMDMDLFVRFEDRSGALQITLFSPFWMINKTGLMLSYKTDAETVDVLYHPPEYNGPILFSFREKFFFDKKAATIRVDNGEWSNNIPLDVAGSIGEVTCRSNELLYQIGVHNHLTHNSLTKQITFIPFYIASNKCDFTIQLQEGTRPGDPWITVEPGACVPLWPKHDSEHLMVVKVQGQTTVPFKYSEVQCTLLKLQNNKYGGINVDVQTTEGGVFIIFTAYNPGDAPGLLINHTGIALTFFEKGIKTEYIIQPQHMVLFTWADPAGEKCICFGKNKVESDLRRDDVGELILPDGSRAYWVSFLDGLQRVLLFTEDSAIAARSESSAALQTITQSIEVRIHGIGLSVVNNETGVDILYIGITSSGVIWECKKTDKKRFKQMNIADTNELEQLYQQYLRANITKESRKYRLDNKVDVDFDNMVLKKNNKDKEIRRTFYPGVWVIMNTSPFQMQMHAKINKIQIDNQLIDVIFPVVLAPIPPPKSVATSVELKPFIECSIVQRVVPNSTVKQFKYATMLIQEFHFKVDLLFLTAVAEMFAGKVSDEQAAKLFNENVASIEKPLSELVETHSMQEQKNFYDKLHLGPLKIHVSFSMAGSDTTALPGILSTLVQGVGVTLTDVNDVVFRLAFFEREYQFFTQQQLTSEITAHYIGQALKQLYVLVLGLDVLGNPYGLVVGLKKGVEDLFYEPFQGAIQGPGEFAEGLALGVKSLFGHTVGGAAGAVSKITGAMGKGLAALTFDEDYQKKRRQYLNKKPANFSEGIARSGKSLVMGFVDGVTGVVTKPVAGAKEEGIEGFFKGLGKGAIGFVAHPTAGVVDFASGSFDAVKRATEGHVDVVRLRPARFIHQDNVLRPYCYAEAEGNKLLKEIEKGKYATTDTFVHCEELVPKEEYLLVTNFRVMCVTKNDLFGTYSIQWKYRWVQVDTITAVDRGVEIKLKKESKKVMGLFNSNEVVRKIIAVKDVVKRNRLVEIMESQLKVT